MNKSQLLKVIESGKFCSVEFIKKDGSIGHVQGRTGVHKHTKGGQRTSDPDKYIMFFDTAKGYRNVNRDTIVKINGISIDSDI